MKFEVNITETRKLAGITAARAAYNAALPEQFTTVTVKPAQAPDEDNPDGVPAATEQRAITPKPGTLTSDGAYVQFVMDKAAESYANQYQS